MTERTSVVQKTQIGVETTYGTAVAASKRLLGTSIATEPQVTTQRFRPLGSKHESLIIPQKEWVQAPITGYPSYGDLVYLLSSVVGTATVTEFMDTAIHTGAFRWVFESDNDTEDVYKSFTVEQGSGVRAHRWAGGVVKEFGLKFNRDTVEQTGSLIAQRITDGITLTASPANVELVPALADSFDLFIDPLRADLGTTKVGRLFDGDFSIGGRYGPMWIVDSSRPSFVNTVELGPDIKFTMMVEADSAGMAYLQTMRQANTVFARIRSVGDIIYQAGIYASNKLKYQLTIDAAIKVASITPFSDHEGVYAVGFEFGIVFDDGYDKAYHIEVINQTATL